MAVTRIFGKGWGDSRHILTRLIAALLLAAAYAIPAHLASEGLDVAHVTASVTGLPEALRGLRVAQISDLHSSRYGEDQSDLIEAITAFKPDIIAISGDFIDGVNPDSKPCEELVRGITGVAPVYWVRGNHEYYLEPDARFAFEAEMESLGACLLDNQAVALSRNGQKYLLAGLDDVQARFSAFPQDASRWDDFGMETTVDFTNILNQNTPAGDYPFRLMLCHRPSYWQPWQQSGYDLALCGHLHGWMARMPGIGGVIRQPSQYFPEADSGLYIKPGMRIYISRGLNNRLGIKNFRLNNKPELTLIEVTG